MAAWLVGVESVLNDKDPAFDPGLGDDPMPEVMFLPLAVPQDEGFGEHDPGVLARRIPDFLHQVLNQGQVGPSGVLEVQSPPEEGPVMWVIMDACPDPEEAFGLLPPSADVRALVTGDLLAVDDGLRVDFHVYFTEDGSERFTSQVGGVLRYEDPIGSLLQLLRRLARMLELPYHEPPKDVLTENSAAFFVFLQALDNAMLLSGDLQINVRQDRELLLSPFAEALELDPDFGLALRIAHMTTVMALANESIDIGQARRFLDMCYSTQPGDGEGCVAVAEQLRDMGDDERAMAWLEHAAHLDPPPARGLESLGVLFANRGETVAARDLWMRGLSVDGHPDFFGHLARLHFAEKRDSDAWEMVVRGLRRLQERIARAAEWDDEDRSGGVLLNYLHEHLEDRLAPEDVVEGVIDLMGMLQGEDQVYLGLCLMRANCRVEARRELAAAASAGLPMEVRDSCVRGLLNIDVEDFERRFAKASEQSMRGRARDSLVELQLWLDLQPEFWPALYFSAMALRRLDDADGALDLLSEAHKLAPERAEVMQQMGQLFEDRGNPKRALELVDDALGLRPEDANLYAAKVRCLMALGRDSLARLGLAMGLEIDPGNQELRRLKRKLH